MPMDNITEPSRVPTLTGSRVHLRPTTVQDVPILVALRNQVRENFFDSRIVDEQSTREWLQASASRGELNWVIETKGTAVGTISASPSERGIEIGRMIIDQTMRRVGLMEEALQLVLPYLTKRYRGPIYLEVKPNNEAARKLYEKLGFTVTRLRMDLQPHDSPL